jgi:hypothetical protein
MTITRDESVLSLEQSVRKPKLNSDYDLTMGREKPGGIIINSPKGGTTHPKHPEIDHYKGFINENGMKPSENSLMGLFGPFNVIGRGLNENNI